MAQQRTFGYKKKDTPIHNINSVAKLIYFLLSSLAIMLTYDTRLILALTLLNGFILYFAKIEWRDVAFFVKLMFVFSLINLVGIYIFEPEYGVELYQSRTILFEGIGRYTVTAEQLFYMFNVTLKYFATVPLVLVFIFTMNPSELSAALNKIGLPYSVAYSVSLTLRYIPDVQRDYQNIRNGQLARGQGLVEQDSVVEKAKSIIKIVMPLLLTSFDRIDTVSQAMMLRRFGTQKKRSWYVEKPLITRDYIVIALGVLVLLAFLVLLWLNNSRFYNPFI